MKASLLLCVAVATAMVAACDDDDNPVAPAGPGSSSASFFVTSARSTTGNLGGLRGADALCQSLANAAGIGNRTWRAYLSAEKDPENGNRPVDARNRIGGGPWFNVNGVLVARDLIELHARRGEATVFVDERGQPIAGQWPGSPRPIEHDILTGSAADGSLLAGMTCADWTSSSSSVSAQVGHSDGLGPGGDTSGSLSSWISAHANQDCSNTAPRGGAGRIYCFAP
jgi:hypothetical protein